jgi:tryptophan-rich sensory protein
MSSTRRFEAATYNGARPTLVRRAAYLVGFVGVCFAAAAVGAALTSTSVGDWYPTLAKPRWTPPAWLFGPVWTTLYLLMGIAAWLIWQRSGWSSGAWPLGLFAVQLLLNVFWSAIFFGLRSPGWAFAEILVLWLAILATVLSFWRRSVMAALLLLPYWTWTTFAAVLNFTIWRMNR